MEEEPDAEQIAQQKAAQKKDEKPNGWEIGYQRFTINGKCLGLWRAGSRQGRPARPVPHPERERDGEHPARVAGPSFQVVALDGNPVPHPQSVDVLELGTAERIDAVVEMKNPGVWVLGTPKDDDRKNGMGIVVEYANKTGEPRWIKPPKKPWDYTIFGESRQPAPSR